VIVISKMVSGQQHSLKSGQLPKGLSECGFLHKWRIGPYSDNPVSRAVAYTSAMTRIALNTLGLLLVSASAAGAQAQVTLAARQYKAQEKIHAKVENFGTQPITICVGIGQWSINKGDISKISSVTSQIKLLSSAHS
jgi:hypothetical protein